MKSVDISKIYKLYVQFLKIICFFFLKFKKISQIRHPHNDFLHRCNAGCPIFRRNLIVKFQDFLNLRKTRCYCESSAKCPVFGRRKWHFLCRSLAIQLFYTWRVWKLFKFVPNFYKLSQNCTTVLCSSEPPSVFLTSVENIWQIINLLKSALSALHKIYRSY
jgi:hypothetical protein